MPPLNARTLAATLLEALAGLAEHGLSAPSADERLRQAGAAVAAACAVHTEMAAGAAGPADAVASLRRVRHLLPVLAPGCQILAADVGQLAVALPPTDLGGAVPSARDRLVGAVLGALVGAPGRPAGVAWEPRLLAGETRWVATIRGDAAAGAPVDRGADARPSADAAAPPEGPAAGSAADGAVAADRSLADPSPADSSAAELAQRGLAPARPLRTEPADIAASGRAVPSGHEARMQELGEMAVSIAHGLNNLLGAVAGESSELLDAAEGMESPGGLRLIHQAALDGAGLARRLLRFSRGESAGGAERLDVVDLRAVLADAVQLTRVRWEDEAGRRGIRVEPRVEAPVPLLVRGVAADLREIVVNLILNAVDAMPSGGTVLLRGEARDGRAIVTCQDSGVGMAPDVRARAFEPFFTTKGAAGTGMGLAIVYGVVARHGGEVQVSSTVGVGTTVTLILPALPPAGPLREHAPGVRRSTDEAGGPVDPAGRAAAAVDTASSAGPGQAGRDAHVPAGSGAGPVVTPPDADEDDALAAELRALDVLVVEDDPAFRRVFARRLGLDARSVEAVGDAAAALSTFRASAWGLVCIDDRLPDMTGRTLAAEIRRRGHACAIVLVTGLATRLDDPALLVPEVDAVLPKPCSDGELLQAVRSARARQASRG